MKHTHILAVFGIVATLASGSAAFAHVSAKTAALQQEHYAAVPSAQKAKSSPVVTQDDGASRVAVRLQSRIERRFNESPSLADLRDAVQVRRALFARSITVSFRDQSTDADVSTWTVSLGRYPEWIAFSLEGGPSFSIDESAIESHLAQNAPDGLSAPSFATVVETRAEGKIVRATIEGTPKDGQVFDTEEIADAVIDAFKRNEDFVAVAVQDVDGAVLYNDGTTTHVLTELGMGRSEFASSPYGRKHNVRKAMNEKANGVVIPQGTVFSFNSTLGGPITNGNGWLDSLIIVNGKDLEPAPGGGICQGATTVFRAAVAAGLPIVTRKSHSLYVHYYKEFGMGLDATVFPGKQDMTFQNDTRGPIVLLGRTDEYDNAYSAIYGVDDDRLVTMEGPFFGYTHKDPVMGRTLRSQEVAWIQHVANADGTTRDQLLVAQYTGLPKSVALEYEPLMHGAADLVADAL
jgi:vancomycin resistance protein YoaR